VAGTPGCSIGAAPLASIAKHPPTPPEHTGIIAGACARTIVDKESGPWLMAHMGIAITP